MSKYFKLKILFVNFFLGILSHFLCNIYASRKCRRKPPQFKTFYRKKNNTCRHMKVHVTFLSVRTHTGGRIFFIKRWPRFLLCPLFCGCCGLAVCVPIRLGPISNLCKHSLERCDIALLEVKRLLLSFVVFYCCCYAVGTVNDGNRAKALITLCSCV